VRYLLLLAGVLTAFFLPAPVSDAHGRGRLIDSIDTFAWSSIVVLVLAASLLATPAPRASSRLFAAGGVTGVLFGVGTLNAVLLGSGLWVLVLAGLSCLHRHHFRWLRVAGDRPVPASPHAAGG
jgi:hypothetical protein